MRTETISINESYEICRFCAVHSGSAVVRVTEMNIPNELLISVVTIVICDACMQFQLAKTVVKALVLFFTSVV